jgi:hypothetical protein
MGVHALGPAVLPWPRVGLEREAARLNAQRLEAMEQRRTPMRGSRGR